MASAIIHSPLGQGRTRAFAGVEEISPAARERRQAKATLAYLAMIELPFT